MRKSISKNVWARAACSLLTVALALAITFTLSCTDNNSQSNGGSSSNLTGTSGTFTDDRDNKSYKWVKIDEQFWLAENLNYPGTELDTLGKCYDNDPANCRTYGRLYDWATAMDLPSGCNTSYCASRVSAKHKGICPFGWHIPSYKEWENLKIFVGYTTSGTKLKALSSLWYNNGYGTDNYGFAALPGGFFLNSRRDFHPPDFYDVGSFGYWWTAKEGSDDYADSYAYIQEMYYRRDTADDYIERKNDFRSVRCIKD